MDGDLSNDRPSSSTDKDTTDCLPHGDSGDSDEESDPIGDDGDANEDLSNSLHSTVSEHCKASTIEQDVRTSSTSNKDPMAPCSNDMTTTVFINLLVKQNLVRKPTERNEDQWINSEEMRQFAKSFKEKRLELGATQKDVVMDLNKMNRFPGRNAPLPIGCVSRLETGRMSLQAMNELKPLLERWLEFQETSRKTLSSESTDLRGKPRTYTSKTCLQNLKEYFQQNPWPSSGEYENLAKLLNMKKKSVRNWFYNHRLNIKPMNSPTGRSIPSSPLVTIPVTTPVTRPVNTPATSPLNTLGSIFRPWESKATIATSDLEVLENDTQHNTKPGAEEIANLAESLTMDKEVVTNSFQNHSQIENRINPPTSCYMPCSTPVTASIATLTVPAASRLPVTAHGNFNILDVLQPTSASTGNDEEDTSGASPRIRNQSFDT